MTVRAPGGGADVPHAARTRSRASATAGAVRRRGSITGAVKHHAAADSNRPITRIYVYEGEWEPHVSVALC
ncbi:hypothetical protein Acsp07_44780 [Actinomycetospora sp. NBRC 106378]|nr:hypothetical protein Acsp07_44780 [Actinomycetospora sp. NBRC 106378]